MHQQQRLNTVLEMLSEHGNVSIADVSEQLGVSTATARRDLNTLATQRLAIRTHGGASALGAGYELPLQYKIARHAEAKLAIAAAVSNIIRPGMTVGMNGGTTLTEVARAIARSDRFASQGGAPGITIVTNALNIAFECAVRENIRVVTTGGVPRRQSYELIGPLVAQSLANYALDIAVIGVDGLTADFGATTVHEGEAEASNHIARRARRVIVAADHTKVGASTFARICTLRDVDTLVTDEHPPPVAAAELANAGVEVIAVGT